MSKMTFNLTGLPPTPKPRKSAKPASKDEILAFLKQRRRKTDASVLAHMKREAERIKRKRKQPVQVLWIEVNGERVRSLLKWRCPVCFAEGEACSKDMSGNNMPCWHCAQCDMHAEFETISDLR